MKVRDAIRILKDNGYKLKSQVGSHQKWVAAGKMFILTKHASDGEDLSPIVKSKFNKLGLN